MSKFNIIKQEIEEIFKSSDCANPFDKEKDPNHSKITLEWVLKLKPTASDELKIAALGHDIDRAMEKRRIKKENFDNYEDYKKEHAKESAKIVSEILKKHNCENKFIEKVKYLIENHEIGGSGDVDILKEADSLTFFNWDIYFYIKDKGHEKTKDKVKFMYKRLSEKAKKLVKEIKFKDRKIQDLVNETISE